MCPRACGVDRNAGEVGYCGVGRFASVASYNPHFGEEAPLVGDGGSGTIFFSGCNLGCDFCQNHEISHAVVGRECSAEELARVMVGLQEAGCHNVNFVTPSHVAAQILEALPLAVEMGLTVPLVYNSSGYDALETLELLDGVMDIYMPDVKFWDGGAAAKYCRGAEEYPERAREAVAAMHAQVGDLALDAGGVAVRGLLVRHLVMPGGLAGTREWMRFLAGVSRGTYVNVMDQYRPCGRAGEHLELGRGITAEEYEEALDAARGAGLVRLDDRSERQAARLLRLLLRGG